MAHRMALAYRNAVAKTLAGAALLVALAAPQRASGSSCGSNLYNQNSLRNAKIGPLVERPPKSDVMRGNDKSKLTCEVRGRRIVFHAPEGDDEADVRLREGERILHSSCIKDRAFLITNKRLRAVTQLNPSEGITRRVGRMTITPMPEEASVERDFSGGVASWSCSYDSCFVIAHGGELTAAFFGKEGARAYRITGMPFPADTAKFVYFSGLLFLSGQDSNVMALSFGESADSRYLPLAWDRGARFVVKDKRLFYGNEGKESEIKVKSPGLWGLEVTGR